MFANTQSIAIHLSVIDVGKTPVPVPMPNIGLTSMAIPNILNMFTEAMPDHNLLTTVPLSNGDQAGILMGVVSNTIMGPVENIIGSFKVFKQVMPATKMLCISTHNTYNTIGMTLSPCQVKVMILS